MATQIPEETAVSEPVSPQAHLLNNRPIVKSQGACMLFNKRSAWPETKGRRGDEEKETECEDEWSESEGGTFVLQVIGGMQAGSLELPSSLLQDTMKL